MGGGGALGRQQEMDGWCVSCRQTADRPARGILQGVWNSHSLSVWPAAKHERVCVCARARTHVFLEKYTCICFCSSRHTSPSIKPLHSSLACSMMRLHLYVLAASETIVSLHQVHRCKIKRHSDTISAKMERTLSLLPCPSALVRKKIV